MRNSGETEGDPSTWVCGESREMKIAKQGIEKETFGVADDSAAVRIGHLEIISQDVVSEGRSSEYLEYPPRIILIVGDTPVTLTSLEHDRWLQPRICKRCRRAGWLLAPCHVAIQCS